jgi:hypothetical protein
MPFRPLVGCEVSSVASLTPNILAKHIKGLVMAREKAGKSCLLATAPAPILFLDWDNRASSVLEFARAKGIKDIYAISMRDKPFPLKPTGSNLTDDIIGRLETSDMRLASVVEHKGDPELRIATLVGDSIASYSELAFNQIFADTPNLARVVKVGSQTIRIPGGWDAWNTEMKTVTALVIRILSLPCHGFFTVHEEREEEPKSSEAEVKQGIVRFTGQVTTYPGRFNHNIRYFNEVWRVKRDSAKGFTPMVYTKPTSEFYTESCLNLDAVEEPNIQKMIAKHLSRLPK